MCLIIRFKNNSHTIQKYKKINPTTHSSNKVYVVKDSIKCLKVHFPSFYFQYLICAFERPLINLHTFKINYFIVLNKNSCSKYKWNWISRVGNLNVLTELQKVHLSYFPSSYNVAFMLFVTLKDKNSQIFKYYVHLTFGVVVCILKETASCDLPQVWWKYRK